MPTHGAGSDGSAVPGGSAVPPDEAVGSNGGRVDDESLFAHATRMVTNARERPPRPERRGERARIAPFFATDEQKRPLKRRLQLSL